MQETIMDTIKCVLLLAIFAVVVGSWIATAGRISGKSGKHIDALNATGLGPGKICVKSWWVYSKRLYLSRLGGGLPFSRRSGLFLMESTSCTTGVSTAGTSGHQLKRADCKEAWCVQGGSH